MLRIRTTEYYAGRFVTMETVGLTFDKLMKMLMAHFGNGWHGFSGGGFFLMLLVFGLLLLAVCSMTGSGQKEK